MSGKKKTQSFYPSDTSQRDAQVMMMTNKPPSPEPLKAQTPQQKVYLKKLRQGHHDILIVSGPAGSGKTYMAMRTAIEQFQKGDFDKIIITRPTVSSGDEDYGYLPGSILDKLSPWCIPLIDIAKEVWSPQQVEHMMLQELIEVAPLGFMRGRTLKRAIIIIDEAQNCDKDQLRMVMTRIGQGSRMIITGDTEQTDLRPRAGERTQSGLEFFVKRLAEREASRSTLPDFITDGIKQPAPDEGYRRERIGVVRLGRADVVRHPVIDEVLALYED